MFDRILIANRGEIACRIIRTCRRLGVQSVAVYSEADANARHVAEADEAVAIGGASAADSYLRADRIIEAALATGAQAIHPGYGFLSEKLELIDACEVHGLRFIGPNRHAIASMGSKIEAKRMARAAGVVCVPGYDGDEQSPERLQAEAARIGFPLLIKASAGGGGKGMRRVNAAEELLPQLALAQREALAAFGDDRVLLEKYIVNPRHLEVQLMGDRHGGLVHLFERECSIQRRFQKVIEEAPAHHLPAEVAAKLYAAALAMGRVMGYDNAGTVEFVLDADAGDTPYFLEVNTRLQVEHPVTELTTGIDLVEWQLRVADGETLPLQQEQIKRSGWAIECRLNAEEPEHDYRASLGTVLGYEEPVRLSGVRIDSGLRQGSEVSPYYDSMLAKVIGHGATREQARQRALLGLTQLRIEGLRTNAALLQQILAHEAFGAVLSTRFLEQHFPVGPLPDAAQRQQHLQAVACAWAASQPMPAPVWGDLRHFRLTAPAGRSAAVALSVREVSEAGARECVSLLARDGVYWLPQAPELRATCAPHPVPVHPEPVEALRQAQGERFEITDADCGVVTLTEHGQAVAQVQVRRAGAQRWYSWSEGLVRIWDVEHELQHRLHASSEQSPELNLNAALPGRISELVVSAGQRVQAGDPVLTLEAMKLYHSLAAPVTGTVRQLHVKTGDIVGHGQLLVEFEAEPEANTLE